MTENEKLIRKINIKFQRTINTLYNYSELYDKKTAGMLHTLGAVGVQIMLKNKKRKDKLKKKR